MVESEFEILHHLNEKNVIKLLKNIKHINKP